jgi:3-hydroxybutyryl-CoA dehydratase
MSGSAGNEYPQHAPADFTPGLERTRTFTITRDELGAFSSVSGDHHPLHRDRAFARGRRYPDVLVHGMLIASRASAFVAYDFVGSHGLLVSMTADFRQPAYCDEPLAWSGRVARVSVAVGTVEIDWQVANMRGVVVQRGTACAWLGNS